MKKRVCMIYTGGTIGMKKTEHGYIPEKNFLKKSLEELKELTYSEVPAFDLIEYDPLLDSSNISVKQWNKIAQDIVERYDDYSGFVVLHGTDTMAYTSSALSFMLQGLNKPVVLTGSQIPLAQIRTDARDNIISSLMIAGDDRAPEVSVFFGNKLFRGNRVKKMSSDEKGAFESPNYPELAELGVNIRYFDRNIAKKGKNLIYTPIKPQKIAVLKIIPGISYKIFKSLMSEVQALVIEGFGTGNIPNTQGDLDELLEIAQKNNTTIVVRSQCVRGTTIIGHYETSAQLKNIDAICSYNMTTESTVAKLYYLLSKGYEKNELKHMMEKNIAGELSKHN